MPTVIIIFGYCFQFFSDDHEPVHIHVLKDGHEAKFNLDPIVELVYNHGFKKHEMSVIEGLLEENVEIIKIRWKEFFKDKKKK